MANRLHGCGMTSLLFAVSLGIPEPPLQAGQTGDVGGLGAEFSLQWGANGAISGAYSYPKQPGTVYRLTGRLLSNGNLYLEEYTGGKLTARCELARTGASTSWAGIMNNTDGRRFRMNVRGLSNPSIATTSTSSGSTSGGGAKASDANTYAGDVGGLAAIYDLRWHDDGSVTGTYRYPAKPGIVYTLRGNNHTKGKLYLEEYTGGKLTATCDLSKSLSDSRIVWSGIMKNTDGRQFRMSMSRDRTRSGSGTVSPSTVSAPSGGTSAAARLAEKDRKKWDHTDRFCEYADALTRFHGCTAVKAKVARLEPTETGTRVVFRVTEGAPYDASLDWKRALGPVPFSPGISTLIHVDSLRVVHTASVWLYPLKWRTADDGRIEFLVNSIDLGRIEGKPFIVRPTRWADFYTQDYFIAVKDIGLVLATFERGAGALELETISLEPDQNDPNPWNPLIKGKLPPVPKSQYIDDWIN